MGAGEGDREGAGQVTSRGDGAAAAPGRMPERQQPGRRRAEPPTSSHSSPTLELKAEALALPDAHQAGWDVVGALRDLGEPAEPAEPEPRRDVAPTPAAPGVSTNVDFEPKPKTRELLDLALLAAVVAAGVAAYLAYDEPTTQTVGIAVTLGVLTLVVWAARAGTTVTTMSVVAGQLKVRSGGQRLTFDLTSHYTPIEVQGDPRRRNWRVLFGRGSMRPFVVDSTIVDPHHFMEVLRRYRPEC